ncbi:response regulator [Elusimicrobiota bacterium]
MSEAENVKMKILVCDDEYATRLVLKAYLKTYPVLAIEASGGEEAIKKVAEENPDVLIIDYSMPGMTGLDVVRELDGRVPVIVITSEGFMEQTEEELKKYAAVYLVKPVTEAIIVAAVEKATGQKITE